MSCDICGKLACIPLFHDSSEQKQYEKVIAAFDLARELRQQVKDSDDQEVQS